MLFRSSYAEGNLVRVGGPESVEVAQTTANLGTTNTSFTGTTAGSTTASSGGSSTPSGSGSGSGY